MKNYIFGAIALTAIIASGCAKEAVESPAPQSRAAKGTPVRISASLDESFKTAYANEKTFSWVDGDLAALVVIKDDDNTKDVITLTAENANGPFADLVGVIPEGYSASDMVWYPYESDSEAYYSSGLGKITDGENMYVRMWGTLAPDLDNPMASIPLVGKRRTDVGDALNFSFHTATGVLRLEIANIPGDAYFVQLDAPSGTALNGNFEIAGDCTINMSDVVGTPWGQKYVYYTPAVDKETRVFYIPVPVGTIPVGTTVSVTSTAKGKMLLATTEEEIEIEANNLYRLPRLVYPSDEWVSMGVGTYKDIVVWNKLGLTGPAQVEFFENPFYPGVYRFDNPYSDAEGLPQFELKVAGRDVTLGAESYNIGIQLTNNYEGTDYTWNAALWDNPYGSSCQGVLKFQSNGLPEVVQLAVCYRDLEGIFVTEYNYAYEIGNDRSTLGVEIVFPGCEGYPAPDGSVEDVIGTYYVMTDIYWGQPAGEMVIEASDNLEKGNVMITTFDAHKCSVSPLYGTYSGGVLNFGKTRESAGLYLDGNEAEHRFANYYEDNNLELDVIRKGVLLKKGVYYGNMYTLGTDSGFDSLWTSYNAFAQ